MLAIEPDTSLVLRIYDPLDCRKVSVAKRIVLITEQTLSSSPMLDRVSPDVHHLASYERLDRFGTISGRKP
jgi:hypothetical protein